MVVKKQKKTINIFRRINDSIGKDRTILLISLGFSLVFWLFVKLSKTYPSEISIPVKWDLPEDKAFSTLPPSSVKVEIEGSGWDLMYRYFLGHRDSLYFNVADLPARLVDRTQLKSKIKKNISSSITVKEIDHDFVQLNFENRLYKKVPVIPAVNINFSPNHYYKTPLTILPDSALVSGPFSFVTSIDTLFTEVETFDKIKNNITRKLRIRNPNEPVLSISPQMVELKIEVEQITEKVYFVPVKIINNKDSIRIFPEKVKVTCIVGLSKFKSISPSDFEVIADMGNVIKKDSSKTIRYQLIKKPDNVVSTHFSPETGDFITVK